MERLRTIQRALGPATPTPGPRPAAAEVDGRPTASLSNGDATVVVDLAGGSISSFTLAGGGANPLSWSQPAPADGSPTAVGHFLCCDRWGQPSDAEIANGMPFHGEASAELWTLGGAGGSGLDMGVELPMAGMSVARQMTMAPSGAAVTVTETVTNDNSLGRVYNVVQHPSIAPPFLDAATVVDCNGAAGFPQSAFPALEQADTGGMHWPLATSGGPATDLRRLGAEHEPGVCSFVVEEEVGWVTAASPSTGLLLGCANPQP